MLANKQVLQRLSGRFRQRWEGKGVSAVLARGAGGGTMIDALRLRLDRWNVWRQLSVNRRIFAAMITVGGFAFVVKLAAVAKELVVAYQFGTGDVLDAFLIAFLLPSFAINVIAGSFNSALIPTYIQLREQGGEEAAQRLFSNVMLLSTALLIVVSGLLALSVSYILPILGSGFSPDKLALTRSLFFVLLPVLVLSGLTTTWAAVLNAGERFALAAMAPMLTPVITVVVLVVMGKVWGIYALAFGTVSGFALEAGLLARGIKRQRLSLVPLWHGMNPALRQTMHQFAPMVAGAFMMSSTVLVDQSMAAMLSAGSVSVLSYGNKVVSGLLGMGSVALGTAVLPHFSRMVAVEDWRGIRHSLRTYTRLILLTTLPLTLGFVYFSEPLVGLLFERGAFTAADTHLVGQVQAFYLLQMPFYMFGILIVRLISSLRANILLMQAASINFFLNIILNYILMQWLGVAGIALSTSIVYLISVVYCLRVFNVRTQILG